MPKRIQRKRVKGWKMPPNTVYVGRPTKWGNPYKATDPLFIRKALDLYERHICLTMSQQDFDELRGKDLACWCKKGALCHADILLKLVNA